MALTGVPLVQILGSCMSSNPFNKFHPIEWLLAVLFIISPLYFHLNVGGTGFRIPNNIVIWFMASVIGFYSLYRLPSKKNIVLPRHYILILAFPVLAFFSGIFSGVEIASQWTFRNLYIWGGVLFFFSLFQYNLKQGRIDRLLFMIVIAGLLQALVGLSQVVLLKNVPAWLPINPSGIPTGLFQQINNQASFQVTCIVIALWLASRPFIVKNSRWRFIVLLIALAGACFVVSYSGSRVGALGFLLAVPLVIISRWKFINKGRKSWGLIVTVMVLAISSASIIETNRGLTSALEKATAMNAGFSGSTRLDMYKIAYDVIKEKPIFGHGIGSFVRVWQLAKPAFYAEYPDAVLPNQLVTHPHNEIIFWLVEGGIISVFGLFCLIITSCLALKKLPASRRYAYAAMLIPIALHTQVELPFYISSTHWFVFLLLLFVLMQPTRRCYSIKLSISAKKLIQIVAIISMVLATVFFAHTMVASLEFKRFILDKVQRETPFPIAMKNPYFKPLATHFVMTSLLHASLHYGLKDNVRLFAEWGQQELKRTPDILFFKLTAEAYFYLKEPANACSVLIDAKGVFPNDSAINKLANKCVEQ